MRNSDRSEKMFTHSSSYRRFSICQRFSRTFSLTPESIELVTDSLENLTWRKDSFRLSFQSMFFSNMFEPIVFMILRAGRMEKWDIHWNMSNRMLWDAVIESHRKRQTPVETETEDGMNGGENRHLDVRVRLHLIPCLRTFNFLQASSLSAIKGICYHRALCNYFNCYSGGRVLSPPSMSQTPLKIDGSPRFPHFYRTFRWTILSKNGSLFHRQSRPRQGRHLRFFQVGGKPYHNLKRRPFLLLAKLQITSMQSWISLAGLFRIFFENLWAISELC